MIITPEHKAVFEDLSKTVKEYQEAIFSAEPQSIEKLKVLTDKINHLAGKLDELIQKSINLQVEKEN